VLVTGSPTRPRLKVQAAEDAWNSRDPGASRWPTSRTPNGNRAELLHWREEIRAFLRGKWSKELDYRLKKTLWGFRENRIAVFFEYESRDEDGH
jgi:hypothetical protein